MISTDFEFRIALPPRVRWRKPIVLGYCLVLLLVANLGFARTAVVSMKSGERLIGKVSEKSNPALLVLESGLLGELKLPRAQIETLSYEQPKVVAPSPSSRAKKVANDGTKQKPPRKETIPSSDRKDEPLDDSRSLIDSLADFKAPDSWRGNLRIGVNLSQGDQQWVETYLRGNLQIAPKDSPNFYRFSGAYTYRETERANGDVVTSTDRYNAEFTFRHDLNERWFLQNLISWRVDQIKGIDRELQELVGVGVRFKPTKRFNFLFGAGGGIEDFKAEIENDRSGSQEVANFFQEANWKPFKKASVVQNFNYFTNPNDSDRFSYVLKAAFRYRLTDLLGLEFSFNQNFDNDVGDGIERDDTRWNNAIVVYF